MLDPLLACQLVDAPDPWMVTKWLTGLTFEPCGIVTVVRLVTHWIPIVWRWYGDKLEAVTWRTLQDAETHLSALNKSLCCALGLSGCVTRGMCEPCSEVDLCGLSSVLFLRRELLFEGLPTSQADLMCTHAVMRRDFQQALPVAGAFRPWIWGSGLDPQSLSRLSNILEQHGVPSPQIASRIQLAVQALGLVAVQKALLTAQPWRNLKSLANQSRPVFQWVLPEELKAAVEAKGQTTKKAKQGKAQQAKPVPVKPIQSSSLDPSKLVFVDGQFVDSKGSPLVQIQPSQLGPLSKGVALASASMVEQFLRAPGPISDTALGILLLDAHEPPTDSKLLWSQVRLAVRCAVNGEPVLIAGSLVQLGKEVVMKAQQQIVDQPPCADAACTKFAIYRDCIVGEWHDFVRSPIKYLVDNVPCLDVCSVQDCKCEKWHQQANSVTSSPILDMWRKQWVNLSFHPTKPGDAEAFLVNCRHLASCSLAILSISGHAGIFSEPRTLDSKLPSREYQIIWLPKATFAEATHTAQVNADILGVARMGSRFGVRVEAAVAAEVSARLRPGSVMLAQGQRIEYEMGPLPFGMDRNGVVSLCKTINWVAKAINPTRTVNGDLGVVWLLHSVITEPPNNVLMTKTGEVVVSKILQKPAASVIPTSVVASNATATLCAHNGGSDPWLVNDPWKSGVAKIPANRPVVNDAMTQLKDVEARLEQSLLSKLQPSGPQAMETDELEQKLDAKIDMHQRDNDARLSALESQMQQLSNRQISLEGTVQEHAQQTKAQFSQFQFQVSAQLESQSSKISDMFTKQMHEFEKLLEKRQRKE